MLLSWCECATPETILGSLLMHSVMLLGSASLPVSASRRVYCRLGGDRWSALLKSLAGPHSPCSSLLTFASALSGPLIWGPASEMLGRRLVYIITGLAYTGELPPCIVVSIHRCSFIARRSTLLRPTAFSFGAAFAPNAGGLLVFRFLIGFFGSASINNVPASIGDYTTLEQRGPFSILCASATLVAHIL